VATFWNELVIRRKKLSLLVYSTLKWHNSDQVCWSTGITYKAPTNLLDKSSRKLQFCYTSLQITSEKENWSPLSISAATGALTNMKHLVALLPAKSLAHHSPIREA